MTWTKVGESRPRDPRLLKVPRSIRWMWLEATVWCNEHQTDGEIPTTALRWITDEEDPESAALQLVAAGLWDRTPDGYLDLIFAEDQPSAEDVDRTRALARERQRRSRQHRQGDHTLCTARNCVVRRESRRDNSVTHGEVTSTDTSRTDPTRPGGTGVGEEDGQAAGAGAPPPAASGEVQPHARFGSMPAARPIPEHHDFTGNCCPLPDIHPVHRRSA